MKSILRKQFYVGRQSRCQFKEGQRDFYVYVGNHGGFWGKE